MFPRWFFNPSEGQIVIVDSLTAVPKDPDSGEAFVDLNLQKMRESDDWFEYESREELNKGK